MPFNNAGTGIENELDFTKYINNKKIGELNILFQLFIEDIFGIIKESEIIYAWKNYLPQKTDIYIRIGTLIKNISIKKGVKNSVHVERISDFIHFLIENGIQRENVIEYLKYHYGDGSTNGKGAERMTASEYKALYQNKIDEVNQNINRPEILKKAVRRFIIQGNNSEELIDAIIYGVVDDFIWIKRENIEDIIVRKGNEYSSGVHFGPLACQPMDRCINRNPLYEKKRYCVQIKWYNLADDIIENMNDRICLMSGRTDKA